MRTTNPPGDMQTDMFQIDAVQKKDATYSQLERRYDTTGEDCEGHLERLGAE